MDAVFRFNHYRHICSIRLLHFFFFFPFFRCKLTLSTALLPNEALPTKSGYLPVTPTSDSAIFYVFYEAQEPTSPLSQTPLLICLQGGPGCSSMLGNFLELGPCRVNFHKGPDEPLVLEPNPGSWNRIFGLLFLDSPIGTGFSIASKPEEIPRVLIKVAQHLYEAITPFIDSNPSFKSPQIYRTGESYAGKYAPAIEYHISKNPEAGAGEASVGGGDSDRGRELERGVGGEEQSNGLAPEHDGCRDSARFNEEGQVQELLRDDDVKRSLGAKRPDVFEVCSDFVKGVLHEDVMKSAKYMVESLVRESSTRVLLYQGNFDLKDGVASTEAWVKTLKWEGIEGFLGADREVWKVNGELAGHVQRCGSLTNAVVFGAGHLLPTDKALNSQAMIEDWVLGKGLFGSVQKDNFSTNSRDQCQFREFKARLVEQFTTILILNPFKCAFVSTIL
ncbi:Serine carboxypeptidase-like [Parasponia andersonii]|uniref:Serine carboxypeptidase-like n=1 Tax=Parasponia andersonii TaxID=3476 RepID=A0A2P5DZT2_PARAD|nr:Serine carboxypeptidase-like [Parasponia andersonii]